MPGATAAGSPSKYITAALADLFSCIGGGDIVSAKALLEGKHKNDKEVLLSATNPAGITLLQHACHSGQAGGVNMLLEKGADPNWTSTKGSTPLHFACNNGHFDCAEALLRAGVDVDAGNANGTTPLIIAAFGAHASCVRLLLEHDADPNVRDKLGRRAGDSLCGTINAVSGRVGVGVGGRSGSSAGGGGAATLSSGGATQGSKTENEPFSETRSLLAVARAQRSTRRGRSDWTASSSTTSTACVDIKRRDAARGSAVGGNAICTHGGTAGGLCASAGAGSARHVDPGPDGSERSPTLATAAEGAGKDARLPSAKLPPPSGLVAGKPSGDIVGHSRCFSSTGTSTSVSGDGNGHGSSGSGSACNGAAQRTIPLSPANTTAKDSVPSVLAAAAAAASRPTPTVAGAASFSGEATPPTLANSPRTTPMPSPAPSPLRASKLSSSSSVLSPQLQQSQLPLRGSSTPTIPSPLAASAATDPESKRSADLKAALAANAAMIRSMQEEERAFSVQSDLLERRRGEAGARRKGAEEHAALLRAQAGELARKDAPGTPITPVTVGGGPNTPASVRGDAGSGRSPEPPPALMPLSPISVGNNNASSVFDTPTRGAAAGEGEGGGGPSPFSALSPSTVSPAASPATAAMAVADGSSAPATPTRRGSRTMPPVPAFTESPTEEPQRGHAAAAPAAAAPAAAAVQAEAADYGGSPSVMEDEEEEGEQGGASEGEQARKALPEARSGAAAPSAASSSSGYSPRCVPRYGLAAAAAAAAVAMSTWEGTSVTPAVSAEPLNRTPVSPPPQASSTSSSTTDNTIITIAISISISDTRSPRIPTLGWWKWAGMAAAAAAAAVGCRGSRRLAEVFQWKAESMGQAATLARARRRCWRRRWSRRVQELEAELRATRRDNRSRDGRSQRTRTNANKRQRAGTTSLFPQRLQHTDAATDGTRGNHHEHQEGRNQCFSPRGAIRITNVATSSPSSSSSLSDPMSPGLRSEVRRLRAEAAARGREHASLAAQHASLVLEKARQAGVLRNRVASADGEVERLSRELREAQEKLEAQAREAEALRRQAEGQEGLLQSRSHVLEQALGSLENIGVALAEERSLNSLNSARSRDNGQGNGDDATTAAGAANGAPVDAAVSSSSSNTGGSGSGGSAEHEGMASSVEQDEEAPSMSVDEHDDTDGGNANNGDNSGGNDNSNSNDGIAGSGSDAASLEGASGDAPNAVGGGSDADGPANANGDREEERYQEDGGAGSVSMRDVGVEENEAAAGAAAGAPVASVTAAGAGERLEGRPQGGLEMARIFSHQQIDAACAGFPDSAIVGRGGFGPVFRGRFMGEDVAVKRLDGYGLQGLPNFLKEVQVLTTCRHEHLVPLLGICVDPTPMLVYPFVGQSLAWHLREPQRRAAIGWRTRLSVALSVSKGLQYLHQPQAGAWGKPVIVHRDVKSENILMDSNLRARLSDVGIARQLDGAGSEASTRLTSLIGTWGYIDPEYQETGVLTPASDVYSLGVVFLELLTGLPAHSAQLRPSCLVDRVNGKQLSECLDSACSWPDTPPVVSFAKEAWQCVSRQGDGRPRLQHLIERMERLDLGDDAGGGAGTAAAGNGDSSGAGPAESAPNASVLATPAPNPASSTALPPGVVAGPALPGSSIAASAAAVAAASAAATAARAATEAAAAAAAAAVASGASSLMPPQPQPQPQQAAPPSRPSPAVADAVAAVTSSPMAAPSPSPEAGRDCMICASAPVQTRFLPCRHSLACTSCASLLRARGDRCPVDRARIIGFETGQFQVTYTGD
ncbi:unnamed protein product [Ectocarpus sp. CCAP 1310/34]|nr:unnamed protein product [Ectocarpus sp. CCAP 1310/34]